jgi:hypothetical protein
MRIVLTPNYAINPTPEQALGSNRAVLPARVIAALALMLRPKVQRNVELISANEWGGVDRVSIAMYDPETIWRLTMIQAFFVGEEPENLRWERLLKYHDLFWLVGPRLWVRLLPLIISDSRKWEGEIGDIFRTSLSFNNPCTDAWGSNYLLFDPFAKSETADKRFNELVKEFSVESTETVRDKVTCAIGGES